MKKIIFALALCTIAVNSACADGNAFTPLNFNDTSYGNSTMTMPAVNNTSNINTLGDEAIGNGNI